MDTNEFYRRLRYALRLDDQETRRMLAALAARHPEQQTPDTDTISAWRQRPEEPGYLEMTPEALQTFMDALILHHRGDPDEPATTPSADTDAGARSQAAQSSRGAAARYDNNAMLKGVRVALSMRVEDIEACIAAGDGAIGKAAINAFFRKPGSRNYRPCGDQVLRQFLKGLAQRQRGAEQ